MVGFMHRYFKSARIGPIYCSRWKFLTTLFFCFECFFFSAVSFRAFLVALLSNRFIFAHIFNSYYLLRGSLRTPFTMIQLTAEKLLHCSKICRISRSDCSLSRSQKLAIRRVTSLQWFILNNKYALKNIVICIKRYSSNISARICNIFTTLQINLLSNLGWLFILKWTNNSKWRILEITCLWLIV